MKTSLILEDSLFDDAKREAQRTGKTISQTISEWARAGRDAKKAEKPKERIVPTLDTGGPARISLDRRSEWMDELDRLDELDKSGKF